MRRNVWLVRWSMAIALCSLVLDSPAAAQSPRAHTYTIEISMPGFVCVGQHGFNLLQNVDINAVHFGAAYIQTVHDTTVVASATPGELAQFGMNYTLALSNKGTAGNPVRLHKEQTEGAEATSPAGRGSAT